MERCFRNGIARKSFFTSFEDWRIRTRMKIFLLEDELSQQIRVEKHIAEIAKELEIKLEVISTGKISEFENYIQNSDIHQLYFLDIHIQDNEYCGLEIAQKYEKQILMPLLFLLLQNQNSLRLPIVIKYLP